MNAEPMSETKVCDKTAMRDLAEGVLALLGDDCFLVLNERNNENISLKMKQSIAHAMTKGNVCHDGMKGIFVQPHCDDAKEFLFLRFVGEPYVIDIDSSRRAIVCKVRVNAAFERRKVQRWRATDEAVSEEVGVEVHTEEAAPQPPMMNTNPHTPGTPPAKPVLNAGETLEKAEQEPPLNDGELAALRALGGELNPAQIAADAEYMTREMMAGLREPAEDEDTEEPSTPQSGYAEPREVVANGCTKPGCPKHPRQGVRSSKGNPRAKRNKTNIPAKLPPNATDGELSRQLKKGLDDTDAHKGNRRVSRGDEVYELTQERSDHRRKHQKQKTTNENIARTMTQGDFEKDGHDAVAYRKDTKVVKSTNDDTGAQDVTTAYVEHEYRLKRQKGKPQS